MNKTRYSATEFGRNKPMNFRPSGTLKQSFRFFPFHDELFKSSFQECITIIVLKIERTRDQRPYRLLQIQEKMAFRLPRSGCFGTPLLLLPQSLYGRTLTSDPKFLGPTGFTKFAYPWCSASSAKKLAVVYYFMNACCLSRGRKPD